jgi:PAS domain S-box-containing protein
MLKTFYEKLFDTIFGQTASYPNNSIDYEDLHILILDIDPEWFHKVEKLLASAGLGGDNLRVKLLQVSTLGQAIEELNRNQFNVVLTDLHLEDATGFLITNQLKNHAAETPLVVITNMANWSTIIKAAQVGVSDFISKRELRPDLLARSVLGAIERGKIEHKLKSSRQLYENLTEMMPVGMVLVTSELNITYANDTFCNSFQISNLKILEKALHELLEPSLHWEKILGNLEKNKDYQEYEAIGKTEASCGKSFLIIARKSEIDINLPAGGYQCIVWDVTEQKSNFIHADIEKKLEFVQQRMGSVFNAINSNLAAIVIDSENVGWQSDTEQKEIILQRIRYSVQSARSIMKPFLYETGDVTVRWEKMDINKLIENCFKNASHGRKKGISFELSLPANTYTLVVEPGHIQRIFNNLFQNAVEAIHDKGIISVDVKSVPHSELKSIIAEAESHVNGWLKIAFKDTGSGIENKLIPRVIEPLYTTKGPLHAGLGLSEVWKLAKLHNGFIKLKSILDKGTEVELYLPIFEEALPPPNTPVSGFVDQNRVCLRVMVVEDDHELREAMVSLLHHLGYSVVNFVNGAEALNHFSKHSGNIDIIITDYYMPVMDGAQLIENLRKLSQSVKVIFMTGCEKQNDLECFDSNYVDAVIYKPYSSDELKEALEKVSKS